MHAATGGSPTQDTGASADAAQQEPTLMPRHSALRYTLGYTKERLVCRSNVLLYVLHHTRGSCISMDMTDIHGEDTF